LKSNNAPECGINRHFKKGGSSDITNLQIFNKINPSELPIIGINSSGNISTAYFTSRLC
jgi:hypothetical protein